MQSYGPATGHNVYRQVPVVDLVRNKLKIACWDSWGSSLIVAGVDGIVRVYDPEGSTSSPFTSSTSSSASLAASSLSTSVCPAGFRETICPVRFGKIFEQLAVVVHQEHSLMLVIVDSVIRVYTLPHFELLHEVEKSRGCYMFAVNKDVVPLGGGSSVTTSSMVNLSSSTTAFPSKHVPLCLAVALKKKTIAVFQWDETNKFVHFTDLQVPDLPRNMDWAGASLCVGLKKDYVLIKVLGGAQYEIFPVGKKSLTTLLPDKEMLLVNDSRGIGVDYEGKPTRKEPIVMSDVPQAICYQHPFVIAVLPNFIEVRNMFTRTLSQTLRLPKGIAITKKEHVFVSTPGAIVYLYYVPLLQQVAELVELAQFKEAVALIEISAESNWAKPADRAAKVKELYALHSYHLFNIQDYQEAMRYFTMTDLSPRQILTLFPDVLPTKQAVSHFDHPARRITGEANLLKALSALIPYLANIRSRIMLNEHAYPDPPDLKADDAMKLPVLIDTVLLKAYLMSDKNLVMPFLEREEGTHCDIEEAQNILRIYDQYEELVCLYRSRGLHREALELLEQLGKDEHNIALYGTTPTIKYLQKLISTSTPQTRNENLRLALDFSKWVLKANADEGLHIFTHGLRPSSDGAEGSIPSELALDHLKKVADPEVCILYLETLVSVGEKSPMFHNELIFMYFEQVKKELDFRRQYGRKKDIIARAGGEREGDYAITGGAGHEPGTLGILRSKLLKFLKESQYYTPEKMLTAFPGDELLEERAILLSRVKKHVQALTIYAHRLRVPDVAEKYCETYYNENSEEEKDMYLYLLQVYLKPDIPGVQPNLDASIKLLTKYYNNIDSTKALELLPRDVPLAQVAKFLSAVLCKNKHILRNNQVVKQLLKAENLQVKSENLKECRKRIFIDNNTACPRCGKKIGNSAFARSPNGGVMHYICSIAKETATPKPKVKEVWEG